MRVGCGCAGCGGGSWLSGVFWKETRLMFVEVRCRCLMAGLHGVDLSQLVSVIHYVGALKCVCVCVCVCEGLRVSLCVCVFQSQFRTGLILWAGV